MTVATKEKGKPGRPSFTPAYVAIIEKTKAGKSVTAGMHPTNEPFVSFQAAAYHRDRIRKALDAKDVAEVVVVENAVEIETERETKGTLRTETALLPGWFLVLNGRA